MRKLTFPILAIATAVVATPAMAVESYGREGVNDAVPALGVGAVGGTLVGVGI